MNTLGPPSQRFVSRLKRTARRRVTVVVALALAAAALAAGVAASANAQQADSDAFSDDNGSVHEPGLEAMAFKGYLAGTECGEGLICPSQPLKRWEMAVWLGRALSWGEPEPIAESRFADVDADEWWAPHVERFADLGITVGCKTEPLRYCPDRVVNRAQMATFFKRAFKLSEAPSAGFVDTAGNTHESNIDALAAAGITVGCQTEPLQYCPRKSVNRAQMATLLARALGLVLVPSAPTLTPEEVYARVAPSIPIVISPYGQGSGILTKGGYVVTNHHVVWPNTFTAATVVFPDGTEYEDVPVVATNPWADLAVLGPLETDERPLFLADGEGLPPGSELYLIGYPAEFELRPEPTITSGILSRVRHWDGYNVTLLQTDAAIAGGQSGGALVDSRGRVVGVSTWGWTEANFGVATSASDDDDIIELMLDALGYDFSIWNRIDFGVDASREWDGELAGGGWHSYFVDEVADSIDLELEGSGEAGLWMANAFDVIIGPDADGEATTSGSAYMDLDDVYFIDVYALGGSDSAASYSLRSSAALLPYIDEDGTVLNPADETQAWAGAWAGVFDYVGDRDWYELRLNRGDTVVVWTDSIDVDTVLRLTDSRGYEVAADDDSGPLGILGFEFNAEIVFEAPSTGTYYAEVYVLDDTSTGSYIINSAILE